MFAEKLLRKLKKKIMKGLAGKKGLQPVFEKLHEFSLAGMHYGGGDNISTSGEKNVIDVLARRIGNGSRPVIFDVGANVGDYASLVMGIFGERAEIYCFEPLNKTFVMLSDAMAAHKNVRTFNFGLGEKAGTVLMYSDGESSKLASAHTRKMDHLGVDITYREEARFCRLDEFCTEHTIDRIDLLKIDVEGGELGVLKGAGPLLDPAKISMIQFEFGPFNISSRTFFHDFYCLLEPRYRIFRVLKDGFRAIGGYKESREIFMTTNYLAVPGDSKI